jgi:short-subunit dehydrogenase
MNSHDFYKEKVILVTGSSSGIGRATALALAEYGSKVVLAARNIDKLISLKAEILSKGGDAIIIQTDMCSSDATNKMIKAAFQIWGRIDILIACAGQYFQDVTNDLDIKLYQQSMTVNFFGTFNSVKSILPEMKRLRRGHIVIINSLNAKKGIVGDGPYVSAKAALDGFADVLRQEMKPFNIKVTSIFPGRVNTPMIDSIEVPAISKKMSPEKVAKAILRAIKRNKATVIVPSTFFMIGVLNNLMPHFCDWAYRVLKIQGQKREVTVS